MNHFGLVMCGNRRMILKVKMWKTIDLSCTLGSFRFEYVSRLRMNTTFEVKASRIPELSVADHKINRDLGIILV